MTLMTLIRGGFLGGGGYVFHRRWISSTCQLSHFRPARVLPASRVITSVTTVTTLGKGLLTYGGYTHAFSGVSVVCERRGYRRLLVTAVRAVTVRTLCDPTSEVKIQQEPVSKGGKG